MRPALAAAAAAASSAASPAAPPGTELSKRSRPRSPPGAAPPAGAACGAGAREAAEAPAAGPELPPPPEPPREGRRRRLNVTSSLSSPRFSPLGSPLDGPLLFAQSPVLVPRSPADVDAADWWTPQLLPQDSPLRFALDELRRYMQDWERAETDDVREGFWHRKSGKAVLSVVICRSKDDGASVAYRGMNAEVSLPAGSLCAERAAIGRAASSFERASDILVVATADPQDKLNPLWPCEVCQSWLAKLRTQNQEISVLAVESISSDRFLVQVNGRPKPPPLPELPTSTLLLGLWKDRVVLAEGTPEMPWDSKDTVYVDGSWAFMHSAHQHILRVARMQCTHLLVGVHSDEVLADESRSTLEGYEFRLQRVLHNRYVSSVLTHAPWILTWDMLSSLGVKRVITGSVGKADDCGRGGGPDPYRVARERGMLEVVESLDDTTESSFHESQVARVARGVTSA